VVQEFGDLRDLAARDARVLRGAIGEMRSHYRHLVHGINRGFPACRELRLFGDRRQGGPRPVVLDAAARMTMRFMPVQGSKLRSELFITSVTQTGALPHHWRA